MPNARLMDKTTLDTAELEASHPLQVVLAFQDIAAGQRAMRMLNGLTRGVGEESELQPSLWSFDLLAAPEWRAQRGHPAYLNEQSESAPGFSGAMGEGRHWPEARNRCCRRRHLRLGGQSGRCRFAPPRSRPGGGPASRPRFFRALASLGTGRQSRTHSSTSRDGHACSGRNSQSSHVSAEVGQKPARATLTTSSRVPR